MDKCVDCGAVLTPEEKFYYGFSCNQCEIKTLAIPPDETAIEEQSCH